MRAVPDAVRLVGPGGFRARILAAAASLAVAGPGGIGSRGLAGAAGTWCGWLDVVNNGLDPASAVPVAARRDQGLRRGCRP